MFDYGEFNLSGLLKTKWEAVRLQLLKFTMTCMFRQAKYAVPIPELYIGSKQTLN